MGPYDGGWRYHDPHHFGHGHHRWHHHHHGPPWADGADGFPIMPVLFTVALLLWVLHRMYGLDTLAAQIRSAIVGKPDAVRPQWDAAVERHAATARSYAAFECDPAAVLHRPALADVREPATARFVDAFAESCALATDEYPGPAAAERFVAATERAERAWAAAVDSAERVRAARFAPGERALVEQALALLSLARSSPHEAERRAAYARARRRLADLERRTGWALPRPAGELLAQRARGTLTAA
jgi:hypothetical protein